jgi:Flp pilus assembly protein TadD
MGHALPHARALGLAAAIALVATACVRASPVQEAMSLARQHREGEAVQKLRAHLAMHPDDVDARSMLVRMLAFAGDRPGAQIEATELVSHLPSGDPRAWIELGHALEVSHDFEGALAAYDTASAIAPRSPAGPREGGMRAARWGEIEEAEPRLAEATRRGANDPETWHALGLVRVHLGDLAGADAAYRAGLAADRRNVECWLGLATVALKRDDGAGALAAYDALLMLRPGFGSYELGRAWALAKLGRRDEARAAIDRAEELGAPPSAVAKQREALR